MNYNQKIDLVQKTKLFIGIDIAKNRHGISLRDQLGKEVGKAQMIDNTRSGLDSLVAMTESCANGETLIGMEPTGHYWKCAAYYLKGKGKRPVIVNPFHVHRTKEVMDNSSTKTDLKDSRLISQMIKEGKFMEPLLLEGVYAELRELTKTRHMIIKNQTSAKIRLIALFDEFAPEYNDCFSNIACKTSIALLKTFTLLGLKSNISAEKKIELIVKTSRGKISLKKAEEIVKKLSESIGISEGVIGVQMRLESLLEQIDLYQKQCAMLDQVIKEKLNQAEEAPILMSMCGMGAITATEFLGQTGPLKNFSNAKKLEKLAGMELSENSSGKVVGKKSFSKRGRDLLRHVLYKVVISAIAHNNELKQLYDYKINVLKKTKMVAIGSIMSKVLRVIFGMVKNKEMYDGEQICAGLPQAKA